MAERTLPGLGLTGFWDYGATGWNDANDVNLQTLSAIAGQSVKSRTSALPGTPTLGDIYLVPSSDGTHPNELAIWDGPSGSEAWVYKTPAEGWSFYVIDEAANYQFDGTDWVLVGASGGGVNVYEDAAAVVAGATELNFTGAGVTVTDDGGGVATIDIPGGGGGGSGGIVDYDVPTGMSILASDSVISGRMYGKLFVAPTAIDIGSIKAMLNSVGSWTFTPAIYALDSSLVPTTLLATGPALAAVVGVNKVPLSSPLTLSANTPYVYCLLPLSSSGVMNFANISSYIYTLYASSLSSPPDPAPTFTESNAYPGAFWLSTDT